MYVLNASSPPLSAKQTAAVIELCLKKSRYFSLRYYSFRGKRNELITELFAHRLCKIKTARWFCYYTLEDNPLEIFLYPSSQTTGEILKKYYTALRPVDAAANAEQREQSLEDLCFFGEDKLILGTVWHEGICKVYPPDEDFAALLLRCYGHWQICDDDREQICLHNYRKR